MKRQGWAAAVGKVYLTRDGREVRLTNYHVMQMASNWDQIEGELLGRLPDCISKVEFDEQGRYVAGGPKETEPPRRLHPLDLIGAKLPAAWPVRAALEIENDAKA